MASIIHNNKGFKVIEASNTEVVTWGGLGICDDCGNPARTGYYVAVLNRWMCPKCYEEWYKNAIRYASDIPAEMRNYRRYLDILGLEE